MTKREFWKATEAKAVEYYDTTIGWWNGLDPQQQCSYSCTALIAFLTILLLFQWRAKRKWKRLAKNTGPALVKALSNLNTATAKLKVYEAKKETKCYCDGKPLSTEADLISKVLNSDFWQVHHGSPSPGMGFQSMTTTVSSSQKQAPAAPAKDVTDIAGVMVDKVLAHVQKLRLEDMKYVKEVNDSASSAIRTFSDKVLTSLQDTLTKTTVSAQATADKALHNADGSLDNAGQRLVEMQEQMTTAINNTVQKLAEVQEDATDCMDNHHRASMRVLRNAINKLADTKPDGDDDDDEEDEDEDD